MKIGDKIRAAREAAGMSKADLARALDVSKTAVGQWESGETAPTRGRMKEVAAILGMSKLQSDADRYGIEAVNIRAEDLERLATELEKSAQSLRRAAAGIRRQSRALV